MEKFKVVIPTYRRANEQLSLEYFRSLGTAPENIYLFVQTEEDKAAYEKRYGKEATIVYREASNVTEARNNILEYFDGRENLLMLDDDIRRIGVLKGDKLVAIESREEMLKYLNYCFEYTAKRGGKLFGVYPIYNAFYMEMSINTKVTVNTVLGFVKGNNMRFDATYPAKEDIEMCGRILSYGGNVYRFNNLAVDAKHRTNDGGCKEVWASNINVSVVKRLCLTYPTIFAPQKNKPQEIRVLLRDDGKIKIGKSR